MLLGTRRHPCFVVAAISQIPWVLAAYRAIGLIGSSGFVVQFFWTAGLGLWASDLYG